MHHQQSRRGAVLLGSDFKALGVVRSLGKHGIPSVVIDNQPRSAWFSRYVFRRFKWHGPMEGEAFLNFLLRTGKEYHLDQWVLFALQDEAIELVARNTQQLAEVYRLITQDWGVLQWALDKRLTYQMAAEVGIPYPKTWYPTCENDLKMIDFTFPMIIKPAISVRLQYAMRLKAIPVSNRHELLKQYRHASSIIKPEEVMIQEIIPGYGQAQYSVATYCKEGQVLLSMTARRTRQFPFDYGLGSSFVEAVEIPDLYEPAKKLLQYMHVSGMVEVEFKYDHRDEQYKLLDINVRPWGWHTLCKACGLDFPYIQFSDVLGQAPKVIEPQYGSRWRRLLTDIPAAVQEIQAGITTPKAYLRSLIGHTVYSVFDLRDPLPALGDFVIALYRSINGFKNKYTKEQH